MVDVGPPVGDIRPLEGPDHRAVGALAASQFRVVGHRQLLTLGLGKSAIQHWLRAGHLYPLFRGVYVVGCASVSWRGRVLGAVLACGTEALASHYTAGLVYVVLSSSRAFVDVTTPRSRKGQRGIRVHRVRTLHPEDRAVIGGIPVTSVSRTLLDLAEVVPQRQLARAVEEAEKRRLLDLRAIERLLGRSHGRRGVKPLRKVIAEYVEPPITRSELERLFIELCDLFGIPRPQTNVITAGREVDGVWHRERLVVEIDSREHHLTTAAFEEDRRRDADLMLAGYRVLRITWRRLRDEPDAVAETLRK